MSLIESMFFFFFLSSSFVFIAEKLLEINQSNTVKCSEIRHCAVIAYLTWLVQNRQYEIIKNRNVIFVLFFACVWVYWILFYF